VGVYGANGLESPISLRYDDSIHVMPLPPAEYSVRETVAAAVRASRFCQTSQLNRSDRSELARANEAARSRQIQSSFSLGVCRTVRYNARCWLPARRG